MPYIDFADVEQLASIEQLADMLGLKCKREKTQLRCSCPIHGGDRSLAISPDVKSRRGSLGVFFCQEAKTGGDRIGLVAHCMDMGQQDAAFFIAEQFGAEDSTVNRNSTSTVSKERATVPQKQEVGANRPASRTFDPDAFAAKLVFNDQVAALKLSEDEAARLLVGWHPQRKALFWGVRNPDASIAGFIRIDDSKRIQLPPQWLDGKVVPFKQRA